MRPSRLRRTFVFLPVCLGVLLLGATTAQAAPDLAMAGPVLFAPYRGGEYHLYRMLPDGTGQTQLTATGRQIHGDWSPDGVKVVYESDQDGNNEIYVMSADGSGQTRLTNNAVPDYDPVWSPDGSRIAFSSQRDGNAEIYVMQADGTGLTRLTTDAGSDEYPSWSPDGSQIAFSSDRVGNSEIYVMAADGTGVTRLTTDPATDISPEWSPDGTRLLFRSYRSGGAQVHVMNADGTGVVQLTSVGTNYNAVWSPDGKQVLFETPREGGGTACLYRMKADGSGQTKVISATAAIDGNPVWAGSQRRIGSVAVAGTATRDLVLRNLGTDMLVVSGITSSDAQFVAAPSSFSVAAGDSQAVTVSFTPTSPGTEYATLTIASNDPEAPSIDLVVNGTGIANTPPKAGFAYALQLDGVDDYVLVPHATAIDPTAQITVEAWVKPAATGLTRIVGKYRNDLTAGWRLWYQSGVFHFGVSSGTDHDLSSATYPAGVWYHLAGTYDQAEGVMRLYVNGVMTEETEYDTGVLSTTEDLRIGDYLAGGSVPMAGQVDEVRLWNTVRTPEEIRHDMRLSLRGDESGLVGYWRLDDGQGTTVADRAIGGNNGALTNADPAVAWVASGVVPGFKAVSGQVFTGYLSGADVDGPAPTFSLAADGTKGSATITDLETGAFTYTPYPGSVGADTFRLRATSDGASDTVDVEVAIMAGPTFAVLDTVQGIRDNMAAIGAAWVDYDRDGNLDLFTANDGGGSRLYRNQGDGTFVDRTEMAGLPGTGICRAMAWGDYDNDGDPDVFLGAFNANDKLYRNNGNGTFTEVGAAAGVGNYGLAEGAAWADYDRDGRLDLFVSNQSGTNRLYRNNGNGTFTDVAASAGVSNGGGTCMGMAWGDYDGDGAPDLFVSRTSNTNLLYRNNGNGTFTEVAAAAGVSEAGSSTSASWADYDNDGHLDLYVVRSSGTSNLLYHNDGDGTFTEVGAAAGVSVAEDGRAGSWGDYDLDGDLDLYQAFVGTANRLYRNNGDGTFTDVAAAEGVANSGNSHAAAWGDYDGDGDLDLCVANFGPGNRIYRNQTTGQWAEVRLSGTSDNRDGIGARVRLAAGGTVQEREVGDGGGYMSQWHGAVHFGLGSIGTIDSVVVRWPSGQHSRLGSGPSSNQLAIGQLGLAQPPETVGIPLTTYPGDSVEIFRVYLIGDGTTALEGVRLILRDLSAATGLQANELAGCMLYLDGEIPAGPLVPVNLDSSIVVIPDTSIVVPSGTTALYTVRVQVAMKAGDGHAFKVAFPAGGLLTSGGGMGSATAASDTNRVRIEVVADRLVFAVHPEPRVLSSGVPLDFAVDPVVEAQDALGNLDTDFADQVTLSLAGPGSGILTHQTVTAAAGRALFAGLTATYTGTPGDLVAFMADDTPDGGEGDLAGPFAGDTLVVAGGTVSWDGGAETANWTDAANWSGDALPGVGNRVVIGPGREVVLTTPAAVLGLDLAGSLTLAGAHLTLADSSAVREGGSLVLVDAASLAGAQMRVAGLVSVATGTTLGVAGRYLQDSGQTSLDGLLIAGDGVVLHGGVLRGNGSVQGSLQNNGTVAPGQPGGILAVTGDYAQSSMGILSMEIAGSTPGTEHDELAVAGIATFGGTLDLHYLPGFAPSPGNAFRLATYTTAEGAFTGITGSPAEITLTYGAEELTAHYGGGGTPSVSETTSAAGLSGVVFAGPGEEVQVLAIGVTGGPGVTVSGAQVVLHDLTDPTGTTGSDLAEVRLYRSLDAVLSPNDQFLGKKSGALLLNEPTTAAAATPDTLIPGQQRFYLVTVALSPTAIDHHALRVGFPAGGLQTTAGPIGTAVVPSDAHRVAVQVVADRLVFRTQPTGAVHGRPLAQQPVLAAMDGHGNLDLDFSAPVTLAISGGSTISGNTVTAVRGVATFTGVTVSGAGAERRLTANGPGDLTGTSTPFDVQRAAASISLTGLTAVANGTPRPVAVTTEPVGLATSLTYNGENTTPSSPGTYAVVATVTDPNYTGSASGTLTIGRATASIALSGLTAVADGLPKAVIATTTPAGLKVSITYNGGNTAPSSPGSYAVVATVADSSYTGSASGTLIIAAPPPAPVAALQATPAQGNPPLSVTFTDRSTGEIGEWFLETYDDTRATSNNRTAATKATYSQPGTYQAVLTVRGPGGQSQTRVTITVNAPPKPIAPPPATTPEDQVLTVDLSGSDPQPGTWTVGELDSRLIAAARVDGSRLLLTPVPEASGTAQVRLVRTNLAGLKAEVLATATWTPVNDPPRIEPALPAVFSIAEDTPLPVAGPSFARDPDTEIARLVWGASGYSPILVAGVQATPAGLVFTPVRDANGETQAVITLTDPTSGQQASQAVTLRWTPVNDPPQAPAAAFPADRATGVSLTPVLSWSARDPDGDAIAYDVTLTAGNTVVSRRSGLPEARLAAGALLPGTAYTWTVVARDGQASSTATFSFTTEADRRPPQILDLRVAAGNDRATVEWRTDESATGRVVCTGTPGSGALPPPVQAGGTSQAYAQQLELAGLQPATWYDYLVTATDPSGNVATMAGRFRTLALPDTRPPQLQVGPLVEGTTTTSAVVRWTTDELSTSVVRFRLVDNGIWRTESASEQVSDHRVRLTELEPAKRYEFEARSADAAAPPNLSKPWTGTFTTLRQPDTVPPAFVAGPAVQGVTEVSAVVVLTASEPASAEVRFGTAEDLAAGRAVTGSAPAREHQLSLTGLTPQTRHYYQVTLTDEAGNRATSEARSFTTRAVADLRPPGYVVPVAVEGITDRSATLVLTADEPVRLQVTIAPKSDPSAITLREDQDLREGHALVLTQLAASTTYRYEVAIEDAARNRAATVAGEFVTLAAPDTEPPRVEGPFFVGITSEGVTVLCRTSEPSTAVVRWAPAAAAKAAETGSSPTGEVVLAEMATEHRAYLRGLDADTEYQVEIVAEDGQRNASTPTSDTFHTYDQPDTEPPRLLSGPEIQGISPTSAEVVVTYNEPVELEVWYDIDPGLGHATQLELPEQERTRRVQLTGLEPGTEYHVRLVARDAAGLRGTPVRTSFTTLAQADQTPPVFVTPPMATEVTATGARLQFSLDEPATAELLVTPVDPSLAVPPPVRSTERRPDHLLAVGGLTPSQGYAFVVRVTNAVGLTSVSEGRFTTSAAEQPTPPEIVIGPTVEKRDDRSATLGLRTSRPAAALVHYRPTSGGAERVESDAELGYNHLLVLTNLIPATAYTYEARVKDELGQLSEPRTGEFATREAPDTRPPVFLGPPTVENVQPDRVTVAWYTDEPSDSQLRVVGADGKEWIARDAVDLTEHRLTVTNLAAGASYQYQVASVDGADNGPTTSALFTFSTPAKPDLLPPVFTGRPVVKGRTPNSLALAWQTDEPASAEVAYGLTPACELGQEARPDLVRDREWVLTGLSPRTVYFVRLRVSDVARNGPTEFALSVETAGEVDREPPRILTGPNAVSTTESGAVIEWTTDEPADGRVIYLLDGGAESAGHADYLRQHRVVLSGLRPGSKYTYTAASQDVARNQPAVSAVLSFTTRAVPDTRPPAIVAGPTPLDVTETRATIYWVTDEPATGAVDYGPTAAYGARLEFGSLEREHRVVLENLTPGTLYHLAVSSRDLAGNAVSTDPRGRQLYSVDHRFATPGQRDTTPPRLVRLPTITWTNTTAVVRWETDEVATSRVDWTGGGNSSFVEDNATVRQHTLTLTGLRPRTGYMVMVTSYDPAGNKLVWGSGGGTAAKWIPVQLDAAGKPLQPPGGAGVFVTDNFADTQYPVIVRGPEIRERTATSITVEWETDELADSFVRFGAGTELADESGTAQDVDRHSITLTNLAPGVAYRLVTASTDPSGNGATESPVIVATTAVELDLSPPRFVRAPAQAGATDDALVIAWETDEPASARVEYHRSGEATLTRQVAERQTRQQVTLTNLAPDAEYFVRVFSADASQNEAEAPVELRLRTDRLPDLTPPRLLSGPEVMSLDATSATVVWSTDELSDSFIDYDTSPYLGATIGDPTYTLEHRLVLTNLAPATAYQFRVGSRDRANNGPVVSEVAQFQTLTGADRTAPPVPTGLAVRPGLGCNLLTWTPSPAPDLAGYAVYRRQADGEWAAIATGVTEARYLDAGLADGQEYQYRVTARDRQTPPNESEASAAVAGTPGLDHVPGAPIITGLEQGAGPERPVVLVENAPAVDPTAVQTYTVQLSAAADFSDVLDRVGGLEEGIRVTRWQVTQILEPGTSYWWRARASDGQLDGPWSTPVLLRPADAAPRPSATGDYDGDGVVSFGDFFLFADGFGGTDPNLDLDGSGRVDFSDFFLFADLFGQTVSGSPRLTRQTATEAGLGLVPTALVSANGEVLVRLDLYGAGHLTGYGCRLTFDPGSLEFLGRAEAGGLLLGRPETNLSLERAGTGQLTIAEHLRGHLPEVPAADSTGLTLRFAVKAHPERAWVRVEEALISRGRGAWAAAGRRGETSLVPLVASLGAVYPNPFNPATSIPVALPQSGPARLTLYNALGQSLREWDLSALGPGFHVVSWDGLDRDGRETASGVYLLRLEAGAFHQTRKVLLAR